MSAQMFHTTRSFMFGQNQTILIPDAYRLEDTELIINRVGVSLIITPKQSLLESFYSGISMLPEDFLADEQSDVARNDLS